MDFGALRPPSRKMAAARRTGKQQPSPVGAREMRRPSLAWQTERLGKEERLVYSVLKLQVKSGLTEEREDHGVRVRGLGELLEDDTVAAEADLDDDHREARAEGRHLAGGGEGGGFSRDFSSTKSPMTESSCARL